MGEVGIYDREGSILRKGDYRRLIGAVGRREGARTGKDGQAEAVVEPDDSLAYVAVRSGFYPTEYEILVSHNL
jgi:hypothetical protein